MLDLTNVHFFVQIVDRGGFTAAAKLLRLPKSTLSQRVKDLESSLGVRLIHRTSRQFVVTEAGREFYQYALVLLRSAELAERAMGERLAKPSGTIRLTTTAEIAQFGTRLVLPTFLSTFRDVKIVEISTDRLVDVVGEGFDLAIRGHTGPLHDSNLVQRPLARAPWYLFAGPEYLRRKSAPTSPADLAEHDIVATTGMGAQRWQLQGPKNQFITLPLEPRFESNNLVSVKEAACANIGIAALPGYVCRAELRAGALRPILPDWTAADARVTALIPYRTGLLPAVRALVDDLVVELPLVTAYDQFEFR